MPKRKRPSLRGPPKVSAIHVSLASDDDPEDEDLLDMLDDELEEGEVDFLARLNPKSLVSVNKKNKKQKVPTATDNETSRMSQRKRGRDSDQSETEFESRPRQSDWAEQEKEVHYFLPLKAEHGRLIHQEPVVMETDKPVDDTPTPVDETAITDTTKEIPVASTPPVLSMIELFARRQEKLSEKKEKIAELASGLVEDPEDNIAYLKRLRDLCIERDPDVAITVRKLAMVSMTTVFKDIAPSYHIRELTDTEKAVKVRREVRKLRNFEEGLLHNYQAFLSLLDDTLKLALNEGGGPQRKRRRERNKPLDELDGGIVLARESLESLGEVALQCLCQLAVSLSHFNFRNNLISVIVPRMASKERQGKVSKMCCETIEKLFSNDKVGDVSLEAVQLISKMVKAKSYKTKPAVLDTLLHLQLSAVDDPVGTAARGKSKEERKRDITKLSKKQRKHLKEEKRLDKDLQEASAIESRDKKAKTQSEILRVVFTTYFRILKNSRHSPLLPPVLRGLAKFAHLISVDFFSDLMSVLHSLAETGGLSNKECMQCVLTAFAILSGQGASLTVDPRQFYVQLYGALIQLDACSNNEDVLLAVECLDQLLRKRRQISLQRVLAFVKRLSTISLHLLPGACLAVMATIRNFMQSYSQTERLLDVESVGGGGVFRPDIPDPEMCHASSTLLWELTIFRHHYDGTVRAYTSHLLAGAPSQGRGALNGANARKSPKELIKDHPINPADPAHDFLMKGAPPIHPWDKQKKNKKVDHYYTDGGLTSKYWAECEENTLEFTQQFMDIQI